MEPLLTITSKGNLKIRGLGFFFSWAAALSSVAQPRETLLTPFETSGGEASATYSEAIAYYQMLAARFPQVQVREAGVTDAGLPLHEVTIAASGFHDPARVRMSDKIIVMVNNGIHAGEPAGIDASMMMARDLATTPAGARLLERLVVVIIPVYNIGGALNRGAPTRVNQNGPIAYGFRGNAANLDLNRDFMKADARNTLAFAEVFHRWKPEIFIDTHTTNGADYPAAMTYIATLQAKAGKQAGPFLHDQFAPAVAARTIRMGTEICPYVNVFNGPPEQGMAAFADLPRYSSGYAALFTCLAFVAEAHMLKPFAERVRATAHFLRAVLEEGFDRHQEVGRVVHEDRTETQRQKRFDLAWAVDSSRRDSIWFKGYESGFVPGALTGAARIAYLRDRPFERFIPWYPHYRATLTVEAPDAYIISQACRGVVERLRASGVRLYPLSRDTVLAVDAFIIDACEAASRPYEGHFYYQKVTARRAHQAVAFRAGDWIAILNQPVNAFIVHALEPEAADSYFRWNFFDAWLSRKEYFSAYSFEAVADGWLKQNPEIRAEFDARKKADASFASDPGAQLQWVYERSPYAETSFRRLPVYRWQGNAQLLIR